MPWNCSKAIDHVKEVALGDEVKRVEMMWRQADEIGKRLLRVSWSSDDAYASLDRHTPLLTILFSNRGQAPDSLRHQFEVMPGRESVPTEYHPDLPSGEYDTDQFRRIQYLYPLLNNLAYALDGRTSFATKNGFMGMGPEEIRVGDQIVVACGCGYLLALRPAKDRRSFTLVGPCYVPAIMEGEWVTVCTQYLGDNFEPDEFHIC